ncbi:MAG: lysine--tRNA ligase [Waddliaceae bacterium]
MIAKPDFECLEEYTLRANKLEELRRLGIEPYPHNYAPTHDANALHSEYGKASVGNSEQAALGQTEKVCVSGRLVLFRPMGKNAFAHIQDHTGRIQVMFNKDNSQISGYDRERLSLAQPPSPLKVIEKKIDIGDIIGVEGHLFHTQKGELTIYVNTLTLLCKTLLPLAEKHAGLHDKEIRYRKRWLDLISNQEVKETFLTRSRILSFIRHQYESAGFIEVETPILQSIYGGAEAQPFLTKLNVLDQQMFMRISIEISLKKLIVGGMDKVFEIGRVFRNEGMDRTHNPEFTMLEAYAAYWDYNDMMIFMENLVERLAVHLFDTTKITVNSTEGPITIDLKAPWTRLTMRESLIKFSGLDVDSQSDQELYQKLIECGQLEAGKVKTFSRGLMIAALFEHLAQPKLIQPHHIIDFPIETTPLCKLHRNPEEREKGIVERFESFIVGEEFCNAYSELNDPIIQRQLLEEQVQRRKAGDQDAHPFDHEFIEAICQGMPPTGGIGIGIDRLVMLLTNADSIRDVLLFPWMKPTQ